MSQLALLGGKPLIKKKIKKYVSIGNNEIDSILKVMKSGNLSGFYGSWEDGFLGGEVVQEFENLWSQYFNVKYSVSVNSNTSGLQAAMGAIGISPGDEVIVPATTMCATSTCALIYGGIPVFADIEDETFCLSLDSVKENITDKTKAIIAVNLFGHPAKLKELRYLCDQKDIFLIEDNAQAICAQENDEFCGTIGDIGVFSLNYHKHIHTGEGGVCVTNNKNLAERLQMIRNHAEAVVEEAGVKDLTNMVGFNFRMTEMSAAVGVAQFNNINHHLSKRTMVSSILNEKLQNLKGIQLPLTRKNCTHSYYNWVVKYDHKQFGISREVFVKALQSEGVPAWHSYVKPLYMLPLFTNRKAIGNQNFPFNLTKRTYGKGLCPIAERLYENELMGIECCAWELDEEMINLIAKAFIKVYQNIDLLHDIDFSMTT